MVPVADSAGTVNGSVHLNGTRGRTRIDTERLPTLNICTFLTSKFRLGNWLNRSLRVEKNLFKQLSSLV